MNFEETIEEDKRKSAAINNLVIDWQYLIAIAPKVFNKEAAASPDFKNICNTLHTLCDRSAKQMEELKAMIPIVREGY